MFFGYWANTHKNDELFTLLAIGVFFIAGRGYPPVAAVAAVGIAAGTGCSAKCCAGN